jgi:hypothetical protein
VVRGAKRSVRSDLALVPSIRWGTLSIGTRRFVRRVDPGFLEMFLGSRLIGHPGTSLE